MPTRSRSLVVIASLLAGPVSLHATTVYTETFDVDHSADWSFTSSLGSTDGPADHAGGDASAFFNYGALVPSADGPGGSTVGMKLSSNLPGTNTFSGVTMTLNSQRFDFANQAYRITAKVWLNYFGGTLSGATEEFGMGVGGTITNPTTSKSGESQFIADASFNSVQFDTSTDGNTGTDWRVYKTPWPGGTAGQVQHGSSGVYAAGTTAAGDNSVLDGSHAYYAGHFHGGAVPPLLQQNAFGNQQPPTTGLPALPGTLAFAWHTWTITTTPHGGPISYYVSDAGGNDVLIATLQGGSTNPYTLGDPANPDSGNRLYFSMFDINSASPFPGFNAEQLLFGLIDDVAVETLVPEPGSSVLILGCMAAPLAFRLGRRSHRSNCADRLAIMPATMATAKPA